MPKSHPNAKNLVECNSGQEAVALLKDIYSKNTDKVYKAFNAVLNDPSIQFDGGTYPYIGINVSPKNMHIDARLSYGFAMNPGVYGTTITQPELFNDYLVEQIDLLIRYHKVPVYVGESDWPIPLPFAGEQSVSEATHKKISQMDLGQLLPNLARVNDDIANNTYHAEGTLPLALFSAERTDYSLHRLYHYTGTSPSHFQSFILLTNYQRYVDRFIAYAHEMLVSDDQYFEFVEPGDVVTNKELMSDGERLTHLPQMPAYHLKRKDGQGITLINIGVGPSNAKTITDHLAVLRPHCWLMVGHCAGLRRSQQLGDYVLAHAYVRGDGVLDDDLDIAIPIPALAEVQVALQEAVANITGQRGREMKAHMRTGTVFTTANRNWELLSQELFGIFKQTRAIAVDMESATIAANGFRFRVPYGILLCVSDKPIHGEIKLRTMANTFYQERVSQHFLICIEAIRLLRELGAENLHSRKLRGFEEPPFR